MPCSAAIELLKDRTITHTEISEAEQIKENKKDFWIDEKIILHNVSAKIQDVVEPIVTPETKVSINKWVNILIVTLGIYCAWMLTDTNYQMEKFV